MGDQGLQGGKIGDLGDLGGLGEKTRVSLATWLAAWAGGLGAQ
jgi:hypothetical protein